MAYGIPQLESELRYADSVCYRTSLEQFEPETAHLFRAAREIPNARAVVHGIYMFRTNPGSKDKAFPDRPAVYVTEANDDESARLVHKSLWNLGSAPYILVLLPDRLRVYTGFDFSPAANDDTGLLEDEPLSLNAARDIIEAFSSESVDVGHIWTTRKYKKKIAPNRRVDKRLLRNLQQLGEALKGVGRLSPEVAHSLIGKYVYIKYLWDRSILTPEWLEQRRISSESVLGRNATVTGFASLVEALDERFNGKVFPLDTSGASGLTDDHVRLTASVFMGDSLFVSATQVARQLYLDFQAYDFRYIPVETLSAVYEQFIESPKEKGAIYTPEAVADYLLSEVNSFKPLTPATTVLDPACGSGIFLVLTYRRLIEQELARQSAERLSPDQLLSLLSNIYGVERERDACYVAEFSLILTLLHYIEPRELHKNDSFKFPRLHNTQIVNGDFFNEQLDIWQRRENFQWIVGNPPWVPADSKQEKARDWIKQNSKTKPVGNLSLAEAFSWRVCDLATEDAVIGLLLPATSLVNIISKKYRQTFFKKTQVLRISNFANWRDVLFPGRSALPPASIIYKGTRDEHPQTQIVHHGPFCINQAQNIQDEPWTIAINEKEVRKIDYSEAEAGRTSTWKFALWGNGYDERAIERIRYLFPKTLERFCAASGWGNDQPNQGAELREHDSTTERFTYVPELADLKRFDTTKFNLTPRPRFSVPDRALVENSKLYMRRGQGSLRINAAPHIILSKGWDFFIYSDESFTIPPQQMGIAAPEPSDQNKALLRALSVYLSSSLVRYYLFFHVPEWGFYRHRESVVLSEVRNIPTPMFSNRQIVALENLQKRLAADEQRALEPFAAPYTSSYEEYQSEIDSTIFKLFELPTDIVNSVSEFVRVRLPLDGGKASVQRVIGEPSNEQLAAYATTLLHELDEFAMDEFHPRITITKSSELVECAIDLTGERPADLSKGIKIVEGGLSAKELLAEIRQSGGEQCSQWSQIQSGLRLFEGPRVYLYKYPRLVDWTKSQALNDARDVIAGAMAAK